MDKEKLTERQRVNFESIINQLSKSLPVPPSNSFLKATEIALEPFIKQGVWTVPVSLVSVFYNVMEFSRNRAFLNDFKEMRWSHLFAKLFLKKYRLQYSKFSEKFIIDRGNYITHFDTRKNSPRIEVDRDARYLFELSADLAIDIFGAKYIQGEHLILCIFSKQSPEIYKFFQREGVDVERLLLEWVASMGLPTEELDLWKRAFLFIECKADLNRLIPKGTGEPWEIGNAAHEAKLGVNKPAQKEHLPVDDETVEEKKESENWRDWETPDTDDDLEYEAKVKEASEEKDTEALFMSREELGRSPAGVDKPAERLEDDLLGRKNDVKALAEMIADEKQGTPFTIGLLGRWGEGKSTVMHMLKDVLEKRKDGQRFKFAKFNAWEYERTSNLSAGLAQEVTRSLIEPLGFWDEWRLRFEFALREHKYKALTPLISLLMLTYLGLLGVFISMWVNPNTGMGENWWYEGIFASVFSLPLAFWYYFKKLSEHPLSVELSTYLRLPSYGEHLGLIPVLKRHIETLCQIRLGTNKERNNNRKEMLGKWDSFIFEKNLEREGELPHRLVVFIDDLDRCDPSSITKTLDAVRLVMDVENVIVVIGIDHRIAFRAVGEHYKDLADGERSQQAIARDYLGKIFQLAIMLDRPQNEELKSFVSEFLFPDAKLDIAKKEQEAEGQELHIEIEDQVEIEDQGLDIEIEEGQEENLWRKEIKFSTKERDLFGELAMVFEFSNPRQLLRLRNSYGLLKLLYGMHGAITFTPYYKNLDSGEVKPKLLILLF